MAKLKVVTVESSLLVAEDSGGRRTMFSVNNIEATALGVDDLSHREIADLYLSPHQGPAGLRVRSEGKDRGPRTRSRRSFLR